jgi:RNase H-like domain found in reverse transcriptase
MKDRPAPTNLTEVQSVMGLFQYYKDFVPDFAKIAAPLYEVMKKGAFKWEKPQQEAFEILKEKMMTAPVLAHPDYTKPFSLTTDTSYRGLGFILSQVGEDGKEHPIKYGGRKLKPAEANYTITEIECLAVVWGIRKNKQFLEQNRFTLTTDHKALKTLRKQELPESARRTRWILELEQYNYDIRHRKGKKIAHADYFSRNVSNIESLKKVRFQEIVEVITYDPNLGSKDPTSAMSLNYASLRKQVKKSPTFHRQQQQHNNNNLIIQQQQHLIILTTMTHNNNYDA